MKNPYGAAWPSFSTSHITLHAKKFTETLSDTKYQVMCDLKIRSYQKNSSGGIPYIIYVRNQHIIRQTTVHKIRKLLYSESLTHSSSEALVKSNRLAGEARRFVSLDKSSAV